MTASGRGSADDERGGLKIVFTDIINVLNRRDSLSVFSELGYDAAGPRPVVVNTYGGDLPILPTFGIRWDF